MWTHTEVKKFIKLHPIQDGGSITPYEVQTYEEDDGDLCVVATLSFRFMNNISMKGMLEFCLAAVEQDSFATHIYMRPDKGVFGSMEVSFGIHFCDPD